MASLVPFLVVREVIVRLPTGICILDAAVAPERKVVRVENYPVLACTVNADFIVCERLCGVKIEDKKERVPLEYKYLIGVVLERNICLWRVQHSML